MIKTRAMREFERQHGRPVEQVLVEALNAHGTVERAALSIGMNPKTFWGWMRLLRVQVKKIASIA